MGILDIILKESFRYFGKEGARKLDKKINKAAAGVKYAVKCPYCGTIYGTNEVCEEITCGDCNKAFITDLTKTMSKCQHCCAVNYGCADSSATCANCKKNYKVNIIKSNSYEKKIIVRTYS